MLCFRKPKTSVAPFWTLLASPSFPRPIVSCKPQKLYGTSYPWQHHFSLYRKAIPVTYIVEFPGIVLFILKLYWVWENFWWGQGSPSSCFFFLWSPNWSQQQQQQLWDIIRIWSRVSDSVFPPDSRGSLLSPNNGDATLHELKRFASVPKLCFPSQMPHFFFRPSSRVACWEERRARCINQYMLKISVCGLPCLISTWILLSNQSIVHELRRSHTGRATRSSIAIS